MKTRPTAFVLLAFCLFLVASCGKPTDFTGFWKVNCTDAFGVQIKKQSGNLFSVSFCGPGGCFAPGKWMPNTPIIGDPKYRVIDPTTIEIGQEKGWDRYTRCTTDTNPKLDYATMPAPNNDTVSGGIAASTPNREDSSAETEPDPHRPPCTGASCRKIEAFLKTHYCGESPAGNGPDNGCDLRERDKRGPNVKVIADYNCEWNESTNEGACKQEGQLTPELRATLVRELRQRGVPNNAPGDTYFKVWQSDRASWSLAEAYYSNRIGSDIEICEVIVALERNTHVIVLRELPLTKTDVDVPKVTDWDPLDLADTRGNGEVDVVLVGDAYEDHWLEVISIKNGSAKTIFSGLGYYL
ncbi:MAG TPA: hypothetical protein VE263_20950 [Candidatus Angelobacter sp.]|nr:hypothetical protein [Candidatus Angelobacter sp.]